MSIPPLSTQLQQLQQQQQSLNPNPPLHLHLHSTLPSTTTKDTPIPHFTSLHRHITTEILDSYAGTKSLSEELQGEGVDEALQREWVGSARRRVLIRLLKEFVLLDEGTKTRGGDRDRDLWAGVLGWLEISLDTGAVEQMGEIEELMKEEIDSFKRLDWRGDLGRDVGKYLERTEGVVRELALELVESSFAAAAMGEDEKRRDGYLSSMSSIPGPRSLQSSKTSTSITGRRHNPPPSPSSTLLQTHISNQNLTTSSLNTLLATLTTTLSTLLSLQSSLLTSQIHRLETFTFSTQTRHLTTRASFLSTVAQGIALKARILALEREREKEANASEGMGGALERIMEELRTEEKMWEGRERGLRSVLQGRGGVGDGSEDMGDVEMERIMGELGREYKNILEETEVVKGDLERLEERARDKSGG